nr:immunoglobulin heavy chain junction region [Macaca mulatta]
CATDAFGSGFDHW